ncbi:hypothetical protein OAI47_01920 [Rhodospirillaceae bacterium]|nr:hypothetical protein [Rhodospirillaceae bacterium]
MGLTFIQENAEKAADDHWHREHMGSLVVYETKHRKFKCKACNRAFLSREEWETHQETAHNFLPPQLIVADKLQPYLVLIRTKKELKKITVRNTQELYILTNQKRYQRVQFDRIKDEDFWKNSTRIEIQLKGVNGQSTNYLINFNEIDEGATAKVSDQFSRYFTSTKGFEWSDILEFEKQLSRDNSYKYGRALANYLRGVKFRNGEFEAKNARRDNYREVFNAAYSELKFYDNNLAYLITSLINLSRLDFSIYRPTGSHPLDYLFKVFFELKHFGGSNILETEYSTRGVPITPTDSSIDALFSLSTRRTITSFESELHHAQEKNLFLPNEMFLAKILYLWKFGIINTKLSSSLIDDFSHNTDFAKFLTNRN